MSVISTLVPQAISAPPSYDERERYEIVDGKRVELQPMSFLATQTAFELGRKIADFADRHQLGRVSVDNMFQFPAPVNRSRRPDMAFLSFQRWPKTRSLRPGENALDVVPDLAVEVISPTDRAEEVQEKVTEYFRAGVRQVWVIYPELAQVFAYESLRKVRGYLREDELEGGDVLSGFRLPLGNLFPEEPAASPPPLT